VVRKKPRFCRKNQKKIDKLVDFIYIVLPMKDRTTVIKDGLLHSVYKKLKLLLSIKDNDLEQIKNLMNSMLNYLDDPIISKLL